MVAIWFSFQRRSDGCEVVQAEFIHPVFEILNVRTSFQSTFRVDFAISRLANSSNDVRTRQQENL